MVSTPYRLARFKQVRPRHKKPCLGSTCQPHKVTRRTLLAGSYVAVMGRLQCAAAERCKGLCRVHGIIPCHGGQASLPQHQCCGALHQRVLDPALPTPPYMLCPLPPPHAPPSMFALNRFGSSGVMVRTVHENTSLAAALAAVFCADPLEMAFRRADVYVVPGAESSSTTGGSQPEAACFLGAPCTMAASNPHLSWARARGTQQVALSKARCIKGECLESSTALNGSTLWWHQGCTWLFWHQP